MLFGPQGEELGLPQELRSAGETNIPVLCFICPKISKRQILNQKNNNNVYIALAVQKVLHYLILHIQTVQWFILCICTGAAEARGTWTRLCVPLLGTAPQHQQPHVWQQTVHSAGGRAGQTGQAVTVVWEPSQAQAGSRDAPLLEHTTQFHLCSLDSTTLGLLLCLSAWWGKIHSCRKDQNREISWNNKKMPLFHLLITAIPRQSFTVVHCVFRSCVYSLVWILTWCRQVRRRPQTRSTSSELHQILDITLPD